MAETYEKIENIQQNGDCKTTVQEVTAKVLTFAAIEKGWNPRNHCHYYLTTRSAAIKVGVATSKHIHREQFEQSESGWRSNPRNMLRLGRHETWVELSRTLNPRLLSSSFSSSNSSYKTVQTEVVAKSL